jgi:GTP-binding protein YchF
MSLELGIIGLPNVGKSTLFNALARTEAACSNYPFCTIDANIGVAPVADERLDRLGEILEPEKLTPATIRFVDIAGLVRGASHGEGLGNRFLANIRDVDAVVHVIRCFDDATVSHVEGAVDPERDIGIVSAELVLADMETASRNLEKRSKDAGRGDKEAGRLVPLLDRVHEGLARGAAVRDQDLSEPELVALREFRFLTALDSLYVANISETDVGEREAQWRARIAGAVSEPDWKVVALAGSLEYELATLDSDDRREFLDGWGLAEPGLQRLVRAGYRLLNLVTFFTIKGVEVRAWTVPAGTGVAAAAGRIHSDMESGFIKAEVVAYEHLVEAGSMHAARDAGHVRTEGRDSVIMDGDVVLVHFQ